MGWSDEGLILVGGWKGKEKESLMWLRFLAH